MNMYPQAGERPEIDLSGVVFEEGYTIPRRETIASGYQKGFAVDPDLLKRWKEGESHAIAAEFVMHYYRSIGCGDTMEIQFTKPHHDDLLAVVVTAKDASGLDWVSHTVWPSSGTLCIEDNR
jgi:hypothetical protein